MNPWWKENQASVEGYVQGISKKALPRFCEIRWESCTLFTFCRQENAIFLPHILTTWEEPFRDSLYMTKLLQRRTRRVHCTQMLPSDRFNQRTYVRTKESSSSWPFMASKAGNFLIVLCQCNLFRLCVRLLAGRRAESPGLCRVTGSDAAAKQWSMKAVDVFKAQQLCQERNFPEIFFMRRIMKLQSLCHGEV